MFSGNVLGQGTDSRPPRRRASATMKACRSALVLSSGWHCRLRVLSTDGVSAGCSAEGSCSWGPSAAVADGTTRRSSRWSTTTLRLARPSSCQAGASGWGTKSDWYRNIELAGQATMTIGWQTLAVSSRVLKRRGGGGGACRLREAQPLDSSSRARRAQPARKVHLRRE